MAGFEVITEVIRQGPLHFGYSVHHKPCIPPG